MTTGQPRVALVAGASRGLGLLIAQELLLRGMDVAVMARHQADLDRAAGLLGQISGGQILAVVGDVTQPHDLANAVARTTEQLGPIDVAIHVAGVIQVGPIAAATLEHFEQCINVMLWGPINMVDAVLPGMRERGFGRVGVVTSIGGEISPPRLVPYSTAKFGAVGYTQGLAAELAGTGITATALIPGLMRTGSHVNATFFGDASKQYAWFAPAASLPLVAMNAQRAARRMVDAVLAGKPVARISLLSHVAARIHGLAPNLTVRMLGLMSRLLPAGMSSDTVTGAEVKQQLRSPAVAALTRRGDRAGNELNESHDNTGNNDFV